MMHSIQVNVYIPMNSNFLLTNLLLFQRIGKHMVISAPTGSGKTKIFELAIVKLLLDLERTGSDRKDVKIVYGKRHSPFGMKTIKSQSYAIFQLLQRKHCAMKYIKCGMQNSSHLT